jgi:hypothetical protein
MTAAAGIMAGGRILAEAIRGVAPLAAYKGADQSVTSSATLASDTDLALSLAASSRYIFIGQLAYTAAAPSAGGLGLSFTWPAGSTGIFSGWGFSPTTGGTANILAVRTATGALLTYGGATGTTVPAYLMGSIQTGATAGNLQLEWAQGASSSTPTVVKAGSWLAAWQTQ